MTWTAKGLSGDVYAEDEFIVPAEEYARVAVQAISGWLWDLEFGLLVNSEKRNENVEK